MTALSGENIAFIGLGLMGRPMALNLEKAGAVLTVNTRNPETLNAFEDLGIATAGTPADAAAEADIVIICVANTPALENVLLGEDGIIDGLEEGTIRHRHGHNVGRSHTALCRCGRRSRRHMD